MARNNGIVLTPEMLQSAYSSLYNSGFAPNTAQPDASMSQIGLNAIDNMQALLYRTGEMAADNFGLPTLAGDFAASAVRNQQEALQSLGGARLDLQDDLSQGRVGRWLAGNIVQQVPQLTAPLLGAGVGALTGGPVGLLAGVGAGLSAGAQMAGGLKFEGASDSTAALAGVGSGIVNTMLGLGPVIGRGISAAMGRAASTATTDAARQQLAAAAGRSFLKQAGVSTGRAAGEEGLAEGLDQVIEEMSKNYTKGKNPLDFSAEQIKDIGYAAFVGGTVGGVLGGAPQYMGDRATQRTAVNQQAAVDAQRDIQGAQSSPWDVTQGTAPTIIPEAVNPSAFDTSVDNDFLGQAGAGLPVNPTPFGASFDDFLNQSTAVGNNPLGTNLGRQRGLRAEEQSANDARWNDAYEQERISQLRRQPASQMVDMQRESWEPVLDEFLAGTPRVSDSNAGTIGDASLSDMIRGATAIGQAQVDYLGQRLDADAIVNESRTQAQEQEARRWQSRLDMQERLQKRSANTSKLMSEWRTRRANEEATINEARARSEKARLDTINNQLKTQKTQISLQEQVNKLLQRQQAESSGTQGMSAADAKQQQQKQAADSIAEQVAQRTAGIVNPQAVEQQRMAQERQQALQIMMARRRQNAMFQDMRNRARLEANPPVQRSSYNVSPSFDTNEQAALDDMQAYQGNQTSPRLTLEQMNAGMRGQGSTQAVNPSLDPIEGPVQEQTQEQVQTSKPMTHKEFVNAMKSLPKAVRQTLDGGPFPDLSKAVKAKNPNTLVKARNRYANEIADQMNFASAAPKGQVRDGHLAAVELMRGMMQQIEAQRIAREQRDAAVAHPDPRVRRLMQMRQVEQQQAQMEGENSVPFENQNLPSREGVREEVQYLDELDQLGLSPDDYYIVSSAAAVQQGLQSARNNDIDIVVRPSLVTQVMRRIADLGLTHVDVAVEGTNPSTGWGTDFARDLDSTEVIGGYRFATPIGVQNFYDNLAATTKKKKHVQKAASIRKLMRSVGVTPPRTLSEVQSLVSRSSDSVSGVRDVFNSALKGFGDAASGAVNAIRKFIPDVSDAGIVTSVVSILLYGVNIYQFNSTIQAQKQLLEDNPEFFSKVHTDMQQAVSRALMNYPALQDRVVVTTAPSIAQLSSGNAKLIEFSSTLAGARVVNGAIEINPDYAQEIERVILHEFGHATDTWIDNSFGVDLFNEMSSSYPELTQAILSRYPVPLDTAANEIKAAEFVALSFELRNDPSIRAIQGFNVLLQELNNADTALQSRPANFFTESLGSHNHDVGDGATFGNRFGESFSISNNLQVRVVGETARTRADIAQDRHDQDLLDINGTIDSLSSIWPGLKSRFLENFIDAFEPVRQLIKSVKEIGRVSYHSNIYKINEALPNTTAAELEKLRTDFVVPLQEAIATYAKVTKAKHNDVALAEVTDYLEAKAEMERKLSLLDRGLPDTYRSFDALNAIIDKYDTAVMLPITKAMQLLNNEKLNILLRNKVLTQDQVDAYRKIYPNYMPLFVDWDAMIEITNPGWARSSLRKSISAGSAQEKFSRRVKGRGDDLASKDPVMAAVRQLYDAAVLGEKIKVQRSVLELIKDNPDSLLLRLVREGKDSTTRLVEFDPTTGNIKTRKLLQDIETDEGGRRVISENTIVCIDEDGIPRRVEFADNRVAAALRGENVVQLGTIMRFANRTGNLLKSLMTSKSPLFWMVNPGRDSQTAALNITSLKDDLRNVVDVDRWDMFETLISKGLEDAFSLITPGTKGVRSALYHFYKTGDIEFKNANLDDDTRKYMRYMGEFIRRGGQSTYFSGTHEKAIQKDILSAINDLNPTTKRQHVAKAMRGISNWMDVVSDSLENKTRYIVFKELVDQIAASTQVSPGMYVTKTGNPLTMDEIFDRAANASMNITVNFSKKGAYAPVLDTLYWFAGANIAGNVRMLQTIIAEGADGNMNWKRLAAFATGPVVAYTGLAMLCRELMGDDEDGINLYDKIPSFTKESNIILPNPFGDKNSYIKIPIAYGYHILWGMGAVADAVMNSALGRKGTDSITDAALGALGNSLDNFNVMGKSTEGWGMIVPSTLRPFYQWMTNTGWTGTPIMPDKKNRQGVERPDSERFFRSSMNPETIALCRWINEATGGSEVASGSVSISPETLEHFASSYTGGMGRILMTASARAAEFMNGRVPDLSKFAGMGVYAGEVRPAATTGIYSGYRDVVQTAVNETKLAMNDRSLSPDRRLELLARNADAYKLSKRLNSIQKQIDDMSKQERLLDRIKGSESKIENLENKKDSLRKEFIRFAIKAGIPASL